MILAIESSCDESAVALFDPASGLRGEWVRSQISLHERHGGVVPDLAAREHLRDLPALIALAGLETPQHFASGSIARVVVTQGPGLAPCLALGVAAAKALALALKVPVAGGNHLRGHAWSPFMPLHAADPAGFSERLRSLLPHLGLIASGGHTILLRIDASLSLSQLSSTRDDAAGEALDKGAKLLGLGYPGGPLIERRAEGGNADAFAFPRGLGQGDGLAFSFSGLKTSLRYRLEKMEPADVEARMADLCASYQAAVVDALASKVRSALSRDGYRSLGLSGGVANNRSLRAALAAEAREGGAAFFAAEPEHSGDNAGMIAFAAWADPAAAEGSGSGLRIEPSLGL